ncbi:hypothetical protein SESBI_34602 [Sesbania bispinosa]|nr:hypothetical protein SESBI_34602 [Sesbania bispinosa]
MCTQVGRVGDSRLGSSVYGKCFPLMSLMEMLLVDNKGGKIHTSIRKPIMRKFKGAVKGEAYRMHYFEVVLNLGPYRATRHEYKLIFHPKTMITMYDVFNISRVALSLKTSEEVMMTNATFYYSLRYLWVVEYGYGCLIGVDIIGDLTKFAKVKLYKGEVVLQNMMNTTKIV